MRSRPPPSAAAARTCPPPRSASCSPAAPSPLGESTRVRRLLPNLGRRMVGAWCFVDHYGPDDIARRAGHAGPAAPAHGPADGQLAARGRGAAPRQPRQQADRTPARTGPDDLRPGHRALRGVARATTPATCTAPSCGSRCPTPTGTSAPAFEHHTRTARGHRRGRPARHGDPRRARRRRLARHRPHPARRRRPHPRRRHGGRGCRSSPTSSTRSCRCPARPRSTASALDPRLPALPRRRPPRPRRCGADDDSSADAAGRRAVRGEGRHVVELRGPHRRGDRRRRAPRGRRVRASARSTATTAPACRPPRCPPPP